MSVITRGSFAKSLYPGVEKWAQLTYKEYPDEYSQMFEVRSSNRAYEETMGFLGMGNAVVKPEGEGVSFGDMEQGFIQRYTMVTYGLAFQITREAYEDNLYPELVSRRSKQLARSFKHAKEEVHANIFNNGFDANFTGWDGVELFSTAHLTKGGFTYRNELAAAADLSEASLEQAAIDIQGFTDPAGLTIAATARKLLIPKELQFTAARILKSELQNDTANNAINAIKTNGTIPEGYMVNHWFDNAKAWFLKTDCQDGLISYQRRDFSIDVDNDTDTQNAKFVGTERYKPYWTDPRGVFASPGL